MDIGCSGADPTSISCSVVAMDQMHDIEMHKASEEFAKCWQAAGVHLQRQAQGPASELAESEPKPAIS